MNTISIQKACQYYRGCRARYTSPHEDFHFTVESICEGAMFGTIEGVKKGANDWLELYWDDLKEDQKVRLYLHHTIHIDQKTMEEYRALHHVVRFDNYLIRSDTPQSIEFMLSRNIDAFNLIEYGLAISIEEPERVWDILDVRPSVEVAPIKEIKRELGYAANFSFRPQPQEAKPKKEKIKVEKIKYTCAVCSDTGLVIDKVTYRERPCVLCKKAIETFVAS